MPHEIARIDNTDAIWCVGDRAAAWHHLGQRTDAAQSWQQAMELAGLNWEVEKIQLLAPAYTTTRGRNEAVRPVNSWGIFRKTDAQFLGAVGRAYTPIQNQFAFDFVDVLLQAENGAHYESAGALGQGERIWTLARIPHDIRIAGTDDVSQTFLLFTTSHDGSSAATAKLSTVRVVCRNTLNMALSGAGAQLYVRHTREAEQRLDAARKLMTGVAMDAQKLEAKLNALATRAMTRETMLLVLDRLFPKPPETNAESSKTRRDNVCMAVLELFEKNDGNAIPEIRGTAYNLLNAVTEYVDHEQDGTKVKDGYTLERARAERALFGTGDALKSTALTAVLEITASNPQRGTRGPSVAVAQVEDARAGMVPDQSEVDQTVERLLKL